jgi:hypothetical protein
LYNKAVKGRQKSQKFIKKITDSDERIDLSGDELDTSEIERPYQSKTNSASSTARTNLYPSINSSSTSSFNQFNSNSFSNQSYLYPTLPGPTTTPASPKVKLPDSSNGNYINVSRINHSSKVSKIMILLAA